MEEHVPPFLSMNLTDIQKTIHQQIVWMELQGSESIPKNFNFKNGYNMIGAFDLPDVDHDEYKVLIGEYQYIPYMPKRHQKNWCDILNIHDVNEENYIVISLINDSHYYILLTTNATDWKPFIFEKEKLHDIFGADYFSP